MSPAASSPAPTPVRVILFSRSLTQPALIDPLHASLKAARGIEFRIVTNGEELISYVVGGDRVLVIANCLLKEDIADMYNALPLLAHRVSEGTLRILVLNSIRHPRLGPLLRERGPIESLELPIALEALHLKIKLAMDFLHETWLRTLGEAVSVKDPNLKAPDWNDLRGAPKVAEEAATVSDPDQPKPARDALAPDRALARTTGLKDIRAPGLAAGEKSFEKLKLSAEALMIQGEKLNPPEEIHIYDLTEHGATLIVPREVGSKNDRIQVRFHLDHGGSKYACTMFWEFKSSDLEMGAKRLATGKFCGGDYAPLAKLIKELDERKKELKEFFASAKG
jgi:hypothetical protein